MTRLIKREPLTKGKKGSCYDVLRGVVSVLCPILEVDGQLLCLVVLDFLIMFYYFIY